MGAIVLLLIMSNLISICFDIIQVLNLSKMEWDLGPKLPEPLWGHCSVMFGGNLVVIGGWSTSQRQYGNKLDSMTSAYVLTGSSWTSLLPLRHGRSTHGCTVTNFRVNDWNIIYMMIFRFNNTMQSNRICTVTCTNNLSQAMGQAIVVAGGIGFDQNALDSVEILRMDRNDDLTKVMI